MGILPVNFSQRCHTLWRILVSTLSTSAWNSRIQHYRTVFIPAYLENNQSLLIAIRAFENSSNRTQFLVVDMNTFKTQVIDAEKLLYRRTANRKSGVNPGYISFQEMQETAYVRAVRTYTDAPYPLFNGGLTHSESQVKGAFMTVDLCPSVAKFEQNFFERLAIKSSKLNQPVPVAVCASGLWLLTHPREFKWLKLREANKHLAITWINHSYSHFYCSDLPNEQNFLLGPNIQLEQEILETERLLLILGETPSVFFRFPGLISQKPQMLLLRRLGLIPVGSNAWLAKEGRPTQGAIVLVHGNGNEPLGMELALPLLDQFDWLPIDQALIKMGI